MPDLIVTDRYDALGIAQPDPETVCDGQCEGTGAVPVHNPEWRSIVGRFSGLSLIVKGDWEDPWKTLWQEAEKKEPTKNGWHFVTCPDCKGTGKS